MCSLQCMQRGQHPVRFEFKLRLAIVLELVSSKHYSSEHGGDMEKWMPPNTHTTEARGGGQAALYRHAAPRPVGALQQAHEAACRGGQLHGQPSAMAP